MGVVDAVSALATRPADCLPVIELFDSVQGEGPAAGRAASFVRLAGCNLSCGAGGGWACDTGRSWQPGVRDRSTWMRPAEIRNQLAPAPRPVVVTGGEPLLQQGRLGWAPLLAAFADRPVWFETNGTLAPTSVTLRRAHLLVVSPKLANTAHRGHQDPAVAPQWRRLARLDDRVHGKFVVDDAADVRAALTAARDLGLPPDRTWLMPQGRTPEQHAATWPLVADAAAHHGVNATARLHVLAWADAPAH